MTDYNEMLPVFEPVIINIRCDFISVTVITDCVTVSSVFGDACKPITCHTTDRRCQREN
jgi:hypothetical protein